MDVDRSTFEAKLLALAERQTAEVERIGFVVVLMFVLGLVASAIWLIAWLVG